MDENNFTDNQGSGLRYQDTSNPDQQYTYGSYDANAQNGSFYAGADPYNPNANANAYGQNTNTNSYGQNINGNFTAQNVNYNPQYNVTPTDSSNSGMGIAAFILSLFGCTAFIGLILGIVDVCKRDGKKKIFSVIAIVISVLWMLGSLVVIVFFKAEVESVINEEKYAATHGATTESTTAHSSDEDEKNNGVVPDSSVPEDTVVDGKLEVGKTYTLSGFSITFAEFGEYKDYEDYAAPAEGNKIVYAVFYAVNNGDSDAYLSYTDFDGYANGTQANAYYGMNTELSLSLPKGRWGSGTIAYEIPADCKMEDFEIEYTPNIFSDKKVVFVGQGDGSPVVADVKMEELTSGDDSQVVNAGETYEKDGVKIKYVECGEYTDYESYQAPADGYKLVYAKFEVANDSDSDTLVAYYDFKCYADNEQMEQKYIGDESSFSLDLSAGRNGNGMITFEVPNDASNIQFEYTPGIISSEHVIFQYK